MDTLAILGQSNASRLWTEASTGLTPAASTYMWDTVNGGWIAPTNSLITFCNALKTATNNEVRILPYAVPGSALLKAADQGSGYWLNKATNSILDKFLSGLAASTANLKAVWWIQGDTECQYGGTYAQYLSALCELHALIAGACGKLPKDLPFIISPVGASGNYASYTNGRTIVNAQRDAVAYPGIALGPEYWNLPVDGSFHMVEASRNTFCSNGVPIFTPIMGVVASGGGGGLTPGAANQKLFTNAAGTDVEWAKGLFCGYTTRAMTAASGTQAVTGLGFKPASILFFANVDATAYQCIGLWDGTHKINAISGNGTAGAWTLDNTGVVELFESGSTNYQVASVQSMDSDGFTLSWTKTGSPTGTANVMFLAFR